eukprot:6200029-Pleurochrysis_carterae.AAC.2
MATPSVRVPFEFTVDKMCSMLRSPRRKTCWQGCMPGLKAINLNAPVRRKQLGFRATAPADWAICPIDAPPTDPTKKRAETVSAVKIAAIGSHAAAAAAAPGISAPNSERAAAIDAASGFSNNKKRNQLTAPVEDEVVMETTVQV